MPEPLSRLPATDFSPQGGLHRPVKALLWDVYGTLLIGAGDKATPEDGPLPPATRLRVARLLKRTGIDAQPEELFDCFRRAVGREHAAARAAGIEYPEIVVEKIWGRTLPELPGMDLRRFALSMEKLLNPVRPTPHAIEVLDTCRKKRIRLGIISNAQFYTPLLLEKELGRDLAALGFEDPSLRIFSYEHGQAKPAPMLFDLALRRLSACGIGPDRAAFIGNDLCNDIGPAARAGFQTVLFTGDAPAPRPGQSSPCCRTARPDLIATDLRQLLLYID